MEFRVNVSTGFMQRLINKVVPNKHPSDISRDALTFYNWAVDEIKNGRIIFSSNQDGQDIKQLSMDELNQLSKNNIENP